MRVIIKHPGHDPFETDVENTLEALQGIVCGNIEVLPVRGDWLCICNEEGKLLGLKPNFRIGCDMVVGPALFCGFDGGEDFTDCPVTLEQMKKKAPEMFGPAVGVLW